MPKLDRYLSREFAQSVLAAFVVLGLISLGGVFADLLSEIARGRVPAGLMLSQLGLRILTFLPILLPLDVRFVDGVPVAFVGMTLQGTGAIVNPAGVTTVDFKAEVATANFYAQVLSWFGVRSLVLLIHQGGRT